jgi:fatty acid desaturase
MVCKECTTALAEQAAYCRPRKDPFVAVILAIGGGLLTGSLLFSLGQLYNGQIKKFIALTLINLFMGGIVAALYLGGSVVSLGIGFLCCLPVFLLPVLVYVYEIYDAYMTAARISRGELAYDWF